MDTSTYTTLTRQSGLNSEMRSIANNIANMSTTGFRREGIVFSEFVSSPEEGPSVSMARATVRDTWTTQGGLTQTGGTYDIAVEGEGFFLIQTPDGQRLSRAGNFAVSADSLLVTNDGYEVLDSGGAPVFIPQDAGEVAIAPDGTISVQGNPISQVGLVMPVNPDELTRQEGVTFIANAGVQPAENGRVMQGFLENSNVNPIREIARMIEVQRAYELGQGFLDKEDARMRKVLETMSR